MLLLAGVVRSNLRQTDFAERELWTSLRPTDSGIIDGVAVLSQLNNDAKLNRLLRDPLLDFVEEEIWSLPGRSRVVRDIRCLLPAAPDSARSGSRRPRW